MVGNSVGLGGGVWCGSMGVAGIAEEPWPRTAELFHHLSVDRWVSGYPGAFVLLASLPLAGCGVIVKVGVGMLGAGKS